MFTDPEFERTIWMSLLSVTPLLVAWLPLLVGHIAAKKTSRPALWKSVGVGCALLAFIAMVIAMFGAARDETNRVVYVLMGFGNFVVMGAGVALFVRAARAKPRPRAHR